MFLLVGAGIAFAAADAFAAAVTITAEKNKETIALSVADATSYKVFTLPSPDRLVIDIPSESRHITLPPGYKDHLIAHVRAGQFNPHTLRLVFDLNAPVRVLKEGQENGRITIAIAAQGAGGRQDTAVTPADTVAADKNSAAENEWPAPAKKGKGETDYRDTDYREKGSKKHYGEKIARNTHGKPVIVIDPGHGGIDPGTEGPDGTYEKDVVLSYARVLKDKLLRTGRYKVLLTRDDDEIIMLRKRVEIARKAGASIFISLHADSAPEDVRGLSVYTVSDKASDQEAEALAARENKADVLTGVNLADAREDVADILISLAERETKNHSATLADELVTTLDGRVRLLSNTHRFAGFAVLKAPDVPSVLIEIGFLSHPREEKLINSKAYRDKVTSGIAAGVDAYFRLEKRMGDE